MVILMGSMMINLLNHWILGYYTAPLDQDMRRMEETHRFLVNDQWEFLSILRMIPTTIEHIYDYQMRNLQYNSSL